MKNFNFKAVLIVIAVIITLGVTFTSFESVDPGEEGFLYRPWSSGIDTSMTYSEGTHLIAPWNELITKSVMDEEAEYSSNVLEKNGLEVTVKVGCNYKMVKGSSADVHLQYGEAAKEKFIDKVILGAIKQVVGQYNAEELYSTKRDALESEIESITMKALTANNFELTLLEVLDVDLPKSIRTSIEALENQKKANLKAKELDEGAKFKANAQRTAAQGDKDAAILRAEGKAQSIELINKQLSKSPQYNEYIKNKGYADHGKSYYGSNNVFGSGTAVFKGLK